MRRDLNGRPVAESGLGRLRSRLGLARLAPQPLHRDDPDLVMVAESTDETAACSTVLAASAWQPDDEAVVRHILRLPSGRVADALATAALDGYEPTTDSGSESDAVDQVTVVLSRVQLLDAVHLSQERSRMASLGSRHAGTVVGWQVWQRSV